MAIDLIDAQLSAVNRVFPGARLERTSDGQRLLVVPNVLLWQGWSRSSVTIRVLVPAGFPHVKPDCFFTEADLKVATGAEPSNSSLQAVVGDQYRWFSWHIASWDPTTGTLVQYIRFCQRRLREPR